MNTFTAPTSDWMYEHQSHLKYMYNTFISPVFANLNITGFTLEQFTRYAFSNSKNISVFQPSDVEEIDPYADLKLCKISNKMADAVVNIRTYCEDNYVWLFRGDLSVLLDNHEWKRM
jgi:hypothetical protein